MRALLLAAGFGTRLRPLTDTVPKCLVPINGKPLLGYWLEMLVLAGVQPMLVNLHYMPDAVKQFLQDGPYSQYVTAVYEDVLLGTAGTLLKNRTFFSEEAVMLVHADNLSKFDVDAFVRCHQQRPLGCEITMMTFTAQDPKSCGIVELDARGVVTAFHEKVAAPPGNLANGAVYIVEPTILDFLEGKGKTEIDFSTEVLPAYLGRIFTYHNSIYHRDIGTLESYNAAQAEYLSHCNQP